MEQKKKERRGGSKIDAWKVRGGVSRGQHHLIERGVPPKRGMRRKLEEKLVPSGEAPVINNGRKFLVTHEKHITGGNKTKMLSLGKAPRVVTEKNLYKRI